MKKRIVGIIGCLVLALIALYLNKLDAVSTFSAAVIIISAMDQ